MPRHFLSPKEAPMSAATLRRSIPQRDRSVEKLCRRLFKVVVPGAAGASPNDGSSAPAPTKAATSVATGPIAKAHKAVTDRTRALGE